MGSKILIAFVLIQTVGGGAEKEIAKKLQRMKEVKEAYVITHPFDIMIKLTARDKDELTAIVHNRIRKIEGVLSTSTHTVISKMPEEKI